MCVSIKFFDPENSERLIHSFAYSLYCKLLRSEGIKGRPYRPRRVSDILTASIHGSKIRLQGEDPILTDKISVSIHTYISSTRRWWNAGEARNPGRRLLYRNDDSVFFSLPVRLMTKTSWLADCWLFLWFDEFRAVDGNYLLHLQIETDYLKSPIPPGGDNAQSSCYWRYTQM